MTYHSDWDNLGYWDPPPTSYEAAAVALARRLWSLADAAASPRVLDVGAGFGAQLGLWRTLGAAHVLALEPNEDRAARAALSSADDSAIEVRASAAARGADGPPASRDLVLALDALYHFDDRARFFLSARRSLDHGGRLAVCTLIAPPASTLTRALLRAVGLLFEIPDGLPTEAQLRRELQEAGFRDVHLVDWSPAVLRGFAAQGDRAATAEAGGRRRLRVAMTRRGCQAALALGVRYMGVCATRRST